ncbi:hypothetical protein AMAG_10603 [Allomyces macrogynus ATCC 38327]|uniref:Uncharacterized protein n=1 Tax=Allomyces macrogynus (strain ATCC 38327) TaxID=578462 RepID=A0A0L0SQW8_ALLM3|nr:hypothetical protein AMAG_10603 [Allomyces macrogynus ATCC 38327]|eukprot:KNE64938.1 hypothetical protein AMAG_10603 [Allomyces macrogynus ATCC 38327]
MATNTITLPSASSSSESAAPPPKYGAAEPATAPPAADPDPLVLAKKGLAAGANFEEAPLPVSMTTIRVLISGDGDSPADLASNTIDWIAGGQYIGEPMTYPLPHCDDNAAVQLYTCQVKKSTFALREPGSNDAPKSLAELVKETESASRLFGIKSDKLELVQVKDKDSKDELVTVEFLLFPQPAVLLALKNSHPYAYLDVLFAILRLAYRADGALYGLFFVTDFQVGQNEHTLTMFVDQFASLCPNLAYIMINYEPRTVIMDGGSYLNVSDRIAPIQALLDARGVQFTAIPATTTMPLVDRPPRLAFYYQQLALVIDILINFKRLGLAVSAHTAKLPKMTALEMWIPALLDLLQAGSKLLDEKHQILQLRRDAIAKKIKEYDQRIAECTETMATADAALARQSQLKVYMPGVMVVLVGITSVAANHFGPVVTVMAVCMLAAGAVGLMQASESKAQQLRVASDEAKNRLPELTAGKTRVEHMMPAATVNIKAIAKCLDMLKSVRDACPTGNDVSVAALIPTRDALIKLCSRAVADLPMRDEDLAELGAAFLRTTGDDAGQVRDLLISLAAQVKKPRDESSAHTGSEPAAARPAVIAMPALFNPNAEQKVRVAAQGPPVPNVHYASAALEQYVKLYNWDLDQLQPPGPELPAIEPNNDLPPDLDAGTDLMDLDLQIGLANLQV